MLEARYGAWPSVISAAELTAQAVGLDRGMVDGDRVYWTEGHPEQGGRVGLWCVEPDSSPQELTPLDNVRNAINSYGGGAWTVSAGILAFSSLPSNDLYLLEAGSPARLLATGGRHRFGCLTIDPVRRLALAVREDHSHSERECINTVVALDLDTDNRDGGRVLAAGADFYANPVIREDGMLAWVQWDHPNMPWDTTSLIVAPLAEPDRAKLVAGGAGTSVLYPTWAADGSLVHLSDASGYWNFHTWDADGVRPLHEHPLDFCWPMWQADPAPYTLLADGRIGCTWVMDGIARLGVLDPTDGRGRLEPFDTGAQFASVTGSGPSVVALFGYADRPTELRLVDLDGCTSRLLRRSAPTTLPPEWVSRAVPRRWQSPDGPVHAWYYPPTNPTVAAPASELPPVQVWCHGGPTGFALPEFRMATQYWTSRGIGILDVNYSGSAGYGRAYRQRLNGQWGIADVRDCIGAALALVDHGLADPARLSIRGGSAGGYTVLRALTTSDVFSAGISLYGVADLEALEADTHKFESRYTQNLVAPFPEGLATYRERSPIHHLDRLSCPMLILQGREDQVVPPNQAEAMAAAVRVKRLPLALVWFDDEGHGFRRAESIIATAEACLSFLGQVLGFTPTGVPALPIENLRQ